MRLRTPHHVTSSGLWRRSGSCALAFSLALCSQSACTRGGQPSDPVAQRPSRQGAQSAHVEPRADDAERAATEPLLTITDRQALAVVARLTGDLGELAFAASPAADNASLWSSSAYRSLVDVIASDVAAIAKRDPQAGVAVRGHAHRLFDVGWLRAQSARFELVAVVNRMDRHFFNPDGCGETRLIYRLSYRQSQGDVRLASRLPMTLSLELKADRAQQPGDCRAAATSWLFPAALSGAALGERLVRAGAPLSPEQLTRARIIQVVSNVQTVRWPSAVRPDLGGHAEYMLRAFAWDAAHARYAARKLENTPDVARLAREPALKKQLAAWLSEPAQLAQLDLALLRLPEQFLAESVVSVTPRGLARRANRPFRSLFEPSVFAALDLSAQQFTRSPEALIRRLDDLTCSGCHQSRSIAGFHLLGEDELEATAGNALFTGSSPHALGDRERRRAYVRALARAEPTSLTRPFAERAAGDRGGYGAHCGLGDRGFSDWGCAEGLHCSAYEASRGEDTVGVCLPEQLGTGDPCEPARVLAHGDAHRDRSERLDARACPHVCERTRVGFPGGMCASDCADLPGEAACGGIAILSPFNTCLAQQRPFAECTRDFVRPAGLRRCSDRAPCRDDYVCARSEGADGVCLPPYFVFQMRVDGHPTPR